MKPKQPARRPSVKKAPQTPAAKKRGKPHPGNKFAANHGPWAEKKYTPLALLEKAIEYLKWCKDNPLKEEMVFGSGFRTEVNKMRAPTIRGFCVYADISSITFFNYENDKSNTEYLNITSRIRDLFYAPKLEGAAAGLLNANIIARELGLTDKQEVKADVSQKSVTVMVNDEETKKLIESGKFFDPE